MKKAKAIVTRESIYSFRWDQNQIKKNLSITPRLKFFREIGSFGQHWCFVDPERPFKSTCTDLDDVGSNYKVKVIALYSI